MLSLGNLETAICQNERTTWLGEGEFGAQDGIENSSSKIGCYLSSATSVAGEGEFGAQDGIENSSSKIGCYLSSYLSRWLLKNRVLPQ